MRTLLAILKDSIRESLDTWSLRILFGLSVLGMLIVLTFSMDPLPAELTMRQFFLVYRESLPLPVMLDSHKPADLDPEGRVQRLNVGEFRLVSVTQLDGDTDSPEGTYRLVITTLGIESPANGEKTFRAALKYAEDFEYLRIESIEELPKQNDRVQYAVTLKGGRNMYRVWACYPVWILRLESPDLESVPMGFQVFAVVTLVMRGGEVLSALVGVIITAFFIPNMLRKGSLELMLSKPMARWELICYKYLGGLVFMLFVNTFALTGIWLVLGLRTGFWANGLLLMILTITFFFAILYAISTCVAVVTRSAIAAILVTVFAWIAFFAIGFAYQYYGPDASARMGRNGMAVREEKLPESGFVRGLQIANKVIPRIGDLNKLNALIGFTDFMTGDLRNIAMFDNTNVNWTESALVSCAWIAVFAGIFALRFTVRDY
ncbi:MAG TPA: ABC transporter permease [Gemmataceae bacterium]|nr:ABC transporter permease [Gemmataceae bacterium]